MKIRFKILIAFICGIITIDNSFAQNDYANYRGPNDDFSTVSAGPLKIAFYDYDILWESADFVGSTSIVLQETPHAGSASPIVYDHKVYLYTIEPYEHSIFDPSPYTRKIPDMYGDTWYPWAFRHLDSYVSATDRIFCIDALTGQTLWVKRLPNRGMYRSGHKEGLNNHTLCASNGKVYFVGIGLDVTCLDANTGELIWTSNEHPAKPSYDKQWIEQLQTGNLINRSRDANQACYVKDGVVVVAGYGWSNNLTGFNAQTGEKLWSVYSGLSETAQPAFWKHNGRHYVICATDGETETSGTARMFDIQTGQKLWQIDGLNNPSISYAVQGDYLFLSKGPFVEGIDGQESAGHLATYHISLNEATLLWEADEIYGFPVAKNTGFFVKDNFLYMRNLNSLYVFDLSSGDMLKEIILFVGERDDQAIMYRINDNIYAIQDSQHGDYVHKVVKMDGNNSEVIGSFIVKSPGFAYSSMLVPCMVDSIVYIRSLNRVRAYNIAQDTSRIKIRNLKTFLTAIVGQETEFDFVVESATGVSKVEIYDNGTLVADTIIENPVETLYFIHDGYKMPAKNTAQTGSFTIIAYDSTGVSKRKNLSYKIVDWYVKMLPDTAYMQPTDKYRFIPLVYEKETNLLLPEYYQPTAMSNATNYASIHDKCKWQTVEGGYIDDSDIGNYFGDYHCSEKGEHQLIAGVTLNGITKYDTSIIMAEKNKSVITFDSYNDNKDYDDNDFTLTATSTSGQPVTIELVSGPATFNGTTVSLTGKGGMLVFKATQPETDDYYAARTKYAKISVNGPPKTEQTISFDAIPDMEHTAAPYALSATSTSGLVVNLSVTSGPATISGNVLTLNGTAGRVTVVASQTGNDIYSRATPVVQTFNVNDSRTSQTISFDDIAQKQTNHEPFTINATASSELPVTVKVKSGPATISGQTVTLTGEMGLVVLVASQDGNNSYRPAVEVEKAFNVVFPSPVYEPPLVSLFEIKENEETITVFPNPVNQHLTITNAIAKPYAIISIAGTVLETGIINGKIEMSQYPSGLYILKINNNFFRVIKK